MWTVRCHEDFSRPENENSPCRNGIRSETRLRKISISGKMSNYLYTGRNAFQVDSGTVWPLTGRAGEPFSLRASDPLTAKKVVKQMSDGQPIVWFIDDERGNREWFRDFHSSDFAVVTFSERAHFRYAIDKQIPCDAVVTDIFFPAKRVSTDAEAKRVLSIYATIQQTRVSDLGALWTREREHWSLDGFRIADDVVRKRPRVPVFLFSRKATLLLQMREFIGATPAVQNSYWLIEKPDPNGNLEDCEAAALPCCHVWSNEARPAWAAVRYQQVTDPVRRVREDVLPF